MNETPLNLAPEPSALPDLPGLELPLVEATPASLEGYGELFDGPEARAIEIVRWLAQGRQQVDPLVPVRAP